MYKAVLIDGNSLANRAFYALPLLSADGVYTNAVLGFLTMLYKVIEDEKPTHVAVAFDVSAPTFRDAMFDGYKGTRKPSPPEFKPQLKLLREVLAVLNVAYFELPGNEADDLLGTLAAKAEAADINAVIVTGDRDSLQLVTPKTTVLMTRKGISEVRRYDPAAVLEDFGVTPPQIIDLKGLMGDSSDNIPGVRGVGEKTAQKLIQQFGSVEAVLEHVAEIKGKTGETIAAHKGDAELSKRLATIDCAVPLEFDWDRLKLAEPTPEAAPLFRRLQFKAFLPKVERFEKAAGDAPAPVPAAATGGTVHVTTPDGAAALAGRAAAGVEVALLVTTDGREVAGAALVLPESQEVAVLEAAAVPGLDPLLTGIGGSRLAGHNLKPALQWALRRGLDPVVPAFDTQLAAYLLDSTRASYDLADLARAYGVADIPREADGPGPRAATLPVLVQRLRTDLAEAGLLDLLDQMELPLTRILAEMEATGVRVDVDGLRRMSQELAGRLAEISQEIYELAGMPININSPKQLADVLFGKLQLPVIKKTGTGAPSTDADVLEELAAQHPLPAKIIDFRTLDKLKGTYVDALPEVVEADGRIHTSFEQTVAATGRLSSKDPNLQNIPIRIEEGRRIRKYFLPREGWLLFACDYSQIELRILAHYSGDPGLVEAFTKGEDIHTRTAAAVYGVAPSAVTPEMRRAAKAVNFGLVYGQTDFGLARQIGSTRAVAREFMEKYFTLYPAVKGYMDETISKARETGYVYTLKGRRRPVPEVNARIFTARQRAEREAINTPIQGTAADLIKLAMIRIWRRLRAERLQARMTLQVHDELVFEVPESELDRLHKLVVEEMEGALPMRVPVRVEAKVGPNWYDMRKL